MMHDFTFLTSHSRIPGPLVHIPYLEVDTDLGDLAVNFFYSLILIPASLPLCELVKDAALLYVILRALVPIEEAIYSKGLIGAAVSYIKSWLRFLCQIFLSLPIVKGKVAKTLSKTLGEVEQSIIERGPEFPDHHILPDHGYSPAEIRDVINQLETMKRSSWETGRLSGAVYHGGSALLKLQTNVFGLYTVANQLHPDCFPAVRRMEAEVVSMVLDLFHGPEGGCGTSTSGGTESLLLACLSARELAKERGIPGIPEIIAPITVHAGVDKAAYYFGMKLLHAPLNKKTMQVDVNAVRNLVGPNTCLLIGSAPNFPHGIIDDIEALSDIALANDLPLHVDACLGSFVVPFLEELGRDVRPFDFRVPGVTSISCDTHKYGFAPKGSSIIMYRNSELRRRQYFVSTDWSGGLYASPTLAGSRPGALMAGCWATLLYFGRDGYKESAKAMILAADKIKSTVRSHEVLSEALEVIGDPQASVVAFTSNVVNVYDLSDRLSKKGWHLSTLQNPAAIHIACTRLTLPVVDQLLDELVDAIVTLRKEGSTKASGETKALYGVAGSVSAPGIAAQLAEGFIDFLYKL